MEEDSLVRLVSVLVIFPSFLIFSCCFIYLKARQINCKIWETWKTFVLLHAAPMREKCLYLEFYRPIFSRIWTEYGEILSISPYSIWMPENTEQKNTEYRHFSKSAPHAITRTSNWHSSLNSNICQCMFFRLFNL